MRSLLHWACWVAVCALSLFVGWRAETQRAAQTPGPRPVYDLPRTARVLGSEDCKYLADFYRSNVASWSQTYFNMLVHRWNGRDERMGAIFDKVVGAANRLGGGGGDYAITNDFFSFRAPGVVQFAMDGLYHTDCDFWKTEASDGFNLWILIDHSGLNTSFDVLERALNPALYATYDGRRSAVLLARNGSDPGTAFKRRLLPPPRFRRGHREVLNWLSTLEAAFRQAMQRWKARQLRTRPGAFDVSSPNASNIALGVGEALVLREQELHRTDMHTPLDPGQFRLVAGFKLQRRNASVRAFDMLCRAQRDRFNIPALWEHVGMPISPVYAAAPSERLAYLDFTGKVLALLRSNGRALSGLALAGAAARAGGVSGARALAATAAGASALLGAVVLVQWPWFAAGSAELQGEGGRLRSAVK